MSEALSSRLGTRAVEYSWRELVRRAAGEGTLTENGNSPKPGADAGIPRISVHYGDWIQGSTDCPRIVVVPAEADSLLRILDRAPHSLDSLREDRMTPAGTQPPLSSSVPVIFWGENHQDRPFAQKQDDNSVIFHVDIIASTFFMLSRWEETVVPDRDEHGRFPATASVAYKQGFLDRPIVDEYALILREWLKVLLPGWEPKRRSFSVQLSHDVDHVRRFANWWKGVRTVVGDVLKRRDLDLAKVDAIDTLAQFIDPRWDSYYRGIHRLAEISRASGLRNDTFYFMAAEQGIIDEGYDIRAPSVRECIDRLVQDGFEIGLHLSYEAFGNPLRLTQEKERFEEVLGCSRYGARYHYLRFCVPESWRLMEQAGFTHDATMGYAERPGFRCGTCHPFPPFDIRQNRELQLEERPLIAMEKTFKTYRELSPGETADELLSLAKRCQCVEGVFSLLWHNTSTLDEWSPSSQTYEQFTRCLAEMEPTKPGRAR